MDIYKKNFYSAYLLKASDVERDVRVEWERTVQDDNITGCDIITVEDGGSDTKVQNMTTLIQCL